MGVINVGTAQDTHYYPGDVIIDGDLVCNGAFQAQQSSVDIIVDELTVTDGTKQVLIQPDAIGTATNHNLSLKHNGTAKALLTANMFGPVAVGGLMCGNSTYGWSEFHASNAGGTVKSKLDHNSIGTVTSNSFYMRVGGSSVVALGTNAFNGTTDGAVFCGTGGAGWKEFHISSGGANAARSAIKTITESVTVAVGQGASGVVTSGNLGVSGVILGAAVKVTTAPGGGATTLDLGITGSGNLDQLIDGMDCTTLDNTAVYPTNGDGTATVVANKTATTLTLTTDGNVTDSDMVVQVTVTYLDTATA